MIFQIDQVLTPEELETITTKLANAEFVDGKATAGWHARLVKHNTQLPKGSAIAQQLTPIIMQALHRHSLFEAFARPKAIRMPLFSRYEGGMSYGSHVDNAMMGSAGQDLMRSDLSLTLFLSAPQTYKGGELVLEQSQVEQRIKLPAGSMVIYPSTTLHRVEPVTSGVRLVVVTWVQSLIRDEGDREILFNLDRVRQSMFEKYGKTPEFDLLSQSYANLLRKWVDL